MKMSVAVVLGLLMPAVVAAEDWPQFLGPRRDGTSKESGLATSWPAAGPPRVWRKEIGPGFAGPIVAGKRLILFHRLEDQEVVECLDASTGAGVWKFAYPTAFEDGFGKGNGPRSTPLIAGSSVVTLGADGWLHCLDLETGKKRWARELLREYKVPPGYFGVGTSPVAFENRVLVNVGGPKAGIVAFDLADGKQLWAATSDAASYSSPILTTVDNAPRAIFFTRQGAVVLDSVTGDVKYSQRWRARYDASVNAAPPLLLDNGAVFFSTSYETGSLLLKLRKDGADPIWTNEDALSSHYSNCVTQGGHIFGCDGRQEAGARLRCIDPRPADGPVVRWSQERFGCASILLVEGQLLMLTERGDLVLAAADPTKYAEKGRAHILDDLPVRAVPAVANGHFYGRDRTHLICLDLRAR